MHLSEMYEIPTSRALIEEFRGYNHNLRIAENEFYDMQNLTSTYYPLLSPRGKRGVYASPVSPQGMISKDALCYVDGDTFYINGEAVGGLKLSTDAKDCPKQLVSMGAYVIVLPDKKFINTKDLTEFGDIEATESTTGVTVTYTLCKQDGTNYGTPTVSAAEPVNPENMDLWIDTSTTPHSLKQYSSTSSMWVQIATTYIKISAPNIARKFKQYDGVKISGIHPALTQLQALEGQTSVLWDVHRDEANEGAGDYLVVIGLLDYVSTQDAEHPLTISRTMPVMDYVIESGNRLWGCRYGLNADGAVVNEIYASKLGDFKNWSCYMGVSTDSYTASCGTDGAFTGAIAHNGYPLFFKETCLHKVYGNFPANFQIQSIPCRGVQNGSSKSLAIVNEVLYYKSRNGVCAYDGSLPSEISTALAEEQYSNAVAGGHDNKYYISMKDKNDVWHLFVYDASKGFWHKEDNTHVESFCSCRNEMYFIDAADKKIKTILGSGNKEADPVKWMAETGVIGTSMPDKKYISSMIIRMAMTIGARITFFIQYDSCGEWKKLMSMTGTSLRSFSVPIRPQRCDHFRLRIVGQGESKIFSITKTIEQGSDL